MTKLREAAQAALDALEQIQGGCTDHDDGTVEAITVWCPEVIADLRAALDAEPAQAVAWMPISVQWPFADLDILFSDGSVVMSVIPQSDGDFWWRGGGAGERFFDPVYSEVTHWRLHDDSPLQAYLRANEVIKAMEEASDRPSSAQSFGNDIWSGIVG